MTAFEAYRLYLALRLHFTDPRYDITKTKGNVKVKEGVLDKRPRMKYALEKLGKRYSRAELIEYFVANFAQNDPHGGLFSENGSHNYTKFLRYTQAMSYWYVHDLQHLANLTSTAHPAILWETKEHPIVMREVLGGRIHIETAVILNKLFHFREPLNERLQDDLIWTSFSQTLYNLAPFIRFDKNAFHTLTHRVFDETPPI